MANAHLLRSNRVRMRIYIAGPMAGIEDLNFPAFFAMEDKIKELGHTPINPAVMPKGLEYAHYMDIALAMVRSAEALLLLPAWEPSKGARAELAYAHSIGIKIINDPSTLAPPC